MTKPTSTYGKGAPTYPLSEREREILRLVVKSFVRTAGPVGSRFLAKTFPIGLSPASIRNTMSDLEDMGYLDHPYTSAGRVPTELGYRVFVDELMESVELSESEKQLLRRELETLMGDTEEMMRESSRLLGRLSSLLAVVLSPRLSTGVLDRLEVVPLSSKRAMIVISVRGGLVRTIVVELDVELRRPQLDRVVSVLNERLAGHTLAEIRKTYASRLRDLEDDETGIVRLVLNENAQLFSEQPESRRISLSGTQNIIAQPEFQDPDQLREVVKLLEDESVVVQLLEDAGEAAGNAPVIRIGRENAAEYAERYSIVTAQYHLGETRGTIGVIGPMRMDYPRVVALVQGMAALLSRPSEDEDQPSSIP
ncbi:heat-inducible transcription repressor HrcA [Rhodothermaceae bacterium RA]|nr:heat-inducible transcription repressor HrcA [Rhodothermaceae bacterium RA]